MSERRKPHNGRDVNGQHHTKLEDVEDKRADVNGEEYVADDVRTGGAVVDTGPDAGRRADRIQEMVDANRDCVDKMGDYNRAL